MTVAWPDPSIPQTEGTSPCASNILEEEVRRHLKRRRAAKKKAVVGMGWFLPVLVFVFGCTLPYVLGCSCSCMSQQARHVHAAAAACIASCCHFTARVGLSPCRACFCAHMGWKMNIYSNVSSSHIIPDTMARAHRCHKTGRRVSMAASSLSDAR